MKSKAIIVDLDGTLCDVDHRVHFVQKHPKDWAGFNSKMSDDLLHNWCQELIDAMRARNYKILFVTGRGDSYQEVTKTWLKKHGIIFDLLLMRSAGDLREDADIKEDLYKERIQNFYDVLFVLDDRASVVERWRNLGLVCLQCAPGNF